MESQWVTFLAIIHYKDSIFMHLFPLIIYILIFIKNITGSNCIISHSTLKIISGSGVTKLRIIEYAM